MRQTAGHGKGRSAASAGILLGAAVFLAAAVVAGPRAPEAGAQEAGPVISSRQGAAQRLNAWWRGGAVLATGGAASLGTYLVSRSRNRIDRRSTGGVSRVSADLELCRRRIAAAVDLDADRVTETLREWFEGKE